MRHLTVPAEPELIDEAYRLRVVSSYGWQRGVLQHAGPTSQLLLSAATAVVR